MSFIIFLVISVILGGCMFLLDGFKGRMMYIVFGFLLFCSLCEKGEGIDMVFVLLSEC